MKAPPTTRPLDESVLATLLRDAERVVDHHTYTIDQTLRGDRLGLAVAIAATMASDASDPSGARASDRIGLPEGAAIHASLGGLPLLRLDRDTYGAPAKPSTTPGAADLSSDFRPLRVLGEGGMGLVILAHQTTLGREVAVKRTKADSSDTSAAASLLGEARIMGALEHPNIVPVHLLARDADGQPVLVMKRIEGVSWRELLANATHPFWDRLQLQSRERLVNNLEILMQVCTAVDFAHSRGIVHRDIKPENIMLGSFGEVYLVDWGIATSWQDALRSNAVVGTPAFMAPEMLHDPGNVSPATDVYLLGATLHYLLTGRYRHEGADLSAVLRAISQRVPLAYDDALPVELQSICRHAMADDPRERMTSAAQLRDALRDFLRHRASVAICDDGKRRLAECHALQSYASEDAELVAQQERRVHQLLTEARFAFEQALREWPENHAADDARQEAISAALDHELTHRNLEGAQRLIAELRAPTEAQRTSLQQLAEQKRALAADHEALVALRREHDPNVGLRTRTIYVTVVIAVIGLFAVGSQVIIAQNGGEFGYALMFGASTAMALMAVGLLIVMRRSNHFTAFNRRAATTILIAILGGLGFRIIAWRLGMVPATSMIIEQWFFLLVFLINGITLHSSIAWGAIPHVIAVAISFWRPSLALLDFSLGGILSFAVLGLIWRKPLKENPTP